MAYLDDHRNNAKENLRVTKVSRLADQVNARGISKALAG
jgi:hypothetical protein